jgi:hypothetical protein
MREIKDREFERIRDKAHVVLQLLIQNFHRGTEEHDEKTAISLDHRNG